MSSRRRSDVPDRTSVLGLFVAGLTIGTATCGLVAAVALAALPDDGAPTRLAGRPAAPGAVASESVELAAGSAPVSRAPERATRSAVPTGPAAARARVGAERTAPGPASAPASALESAPASTVATAAPETEAPGRTGFAEAPAAAAAPEESPGLRAAEPTDPPAPTAVEHPGRGPEQRRDRRHDDDVPSTAGRSNGAAAPSETPSSTPSAPTPGPSVTSNDGNAALPPGLPDLLEALLRGLTGR